MVAIRFCPAVRKKSGTGNYRHSTPFTEAVQAEKRVVKCADEKTVVNSLNIFGKVLGSLPFTVKRIKSVSGIEVFVYKFRDNVTEFGVKTRIEKKPVSSLFSRRVKRSRKTGLDLIRVTLNLARGDLEASILAC